MSRCRWYPEHGRDYTFASNFICRHKKHLHSKIIDWFNTIWFSPLADWLRMMLRHVQRNTTKQGKHLCPLSPNAISGLPDSHIQYPCCWFSMMPIAGSVLPRGGGLLGSIANNWRWIGCLTTLPFDPLRPRRKACYRASQLMTSGRFCGFWKTVRSSGGHDPALACSVAPALHHRAAHQGWNWLRIAASKPGGFQLYLNDKVNGPTGGRRCKVSFLTVQGILATMASLAYQGNQSAVFCSISPPLCWPSGRAPAPTGIKRRHQMQAIIGPCVGWGGSPRMVLPSMAMIDWPATAWRLGIDPGKQGVQPAVR